MTNSVRKMLDSKEAKRADAVQVRYESLHVEPGFNLRQQDQDLEESIEALALHIFNSGKFPPLEVRPRDEGGMWIVDGHRRHAAIGRALDRGAPLRSPKDGEAWIHVVVFEGNEEDRIARIITSANNKPLAPAEIAEGYKRLRAFNWTPAQIAKKVGKSVQHVQDLLALGNAPSPVRAMVKAGQVSATIAAKATRKHGEKATAVLGEQLQQAQAQGKKRITAATTDKPKASASEVEQLRAKVAELESKVGRFQGIPLPLNAATGGNEWQGEVGPDALLEPACNAINAIASAAPAGQPLCWVFEDELPESLTTDAYNALYPHSRVDVVRMFPIYGPAAPAVDAPAPVDGCTDPYNCARCKAHPNHRQGLEHAGISRPRAAAKTGGAA